MPCDDSQSVNSAILCDDPQVLKRDSFNQSVSSSLNMPARNSVRWTVRNSISSASLNRYKSVFFRNGINHASVSSNYSSTSSFPLFRQFYFMRTPLKHRRQHSVRKRTHLADVLLSEKLHKAPRIEVKHVVVTMLITITSAVLLIFMIFLDWAYLNNSISTETQQALLVSNSNMCFLYPGVCATKGLIIVVFILMTIILCYCILMLYISARRHSRLLEQKTSELEKEKCLTEKLLHQILPPCVAKDLINGRKAPAEYYDSVTVYFSDIVGFTSIASICSPNETCHMLNQLYSIFDGLIENFDVYKVETIGDAYMVVSGAPEKNGDRHPNEIANMSLSLLHGKQQVRVPRTSAELELRIGIHTGPVCAAVIGSKMPRYCMFGDTVNVASRMESTGLPERIHLSHDTYQRLKNPEQYVFEERGEIEIKGKGPMRTYFLLSRVSESPVICRSNSSMEINQDV